MIPCKLVHHTGTMIRFRTSQLGDLPKASQDVALLLPTGRIVTGRFNRNLKNPNVSGESLVQYVKRRLGFGEREDVLLERRRADLWVLHLLKDAVAAAEDVKLSPTGIHRVREGALKFHDLAALVNLADHEDQRGRRVQEYKRVLRPAGLRRLVLNAVGASACMVRDCDASEHFEAAWGAGSGAVIVEVHHVEQVARAVDHHPRNLCILCANHHRFVHGSGSWTVRHDGPDVILGRANHELVIRRPDTFAA